MTIGIALIILSQRWTCWSHSGFLLSGITISVSTVKRSDPIPIGCAFGDHDHQRHSPCSFPMLTVARLFDRRSRLCGSLLISLSANLCNTETILCFDRVEYLDHAKRLARPSRCSNGGKKGGNVAARFDGNANTRVDLKTMTIAGSTVASTYINCVTITINRCKEDNVQ